jgi:ATP-binding cassette subfamily B protein RaxB
MSPANAIRFWGKRRVPLVLQTEAAECGLACLAMVAGYHGHRIDLPSLRRRHSISLKGMNLMHLIGLAASLKLAARPVKVELEDLRRYQAPVILHWDFNHFVVLVRVEGQIAVIHDPASSCRRMPMQEVSRHYTGVLLELLPTEDFQIREERQTITLSALVGRMPGWLRIGGQILTLALTLEVVSLASPLFMQLVVDSAVVSADHDLLTVLALGFLLLAVVQVAVTTLRSWVVLSLGVSLHLNLLNRLFSHLLRLPMDFFDKRHLGDVVSRFESVNVIQRTLTSSFIEAIVDGLMALATLAMMAYYSAKLAGIVVMAALGYGLLRLSLYRPLRDASEEHIVCQAKQQTHFLETVRGIQGVKLFNRQAQRHASYQNLMVDSFNADIRIQKLNILYKALNGLLFGAENVAVIWLGATLILAGGFSVGMLFAFASYKQQFTSRVIGFIEKGIEFRMLGLHLERVADVALSPMETADSGWNLLAMPASHDLEVDRVSFSYSELEPYVLHDLSLGIGAGESVAIVGPSGCGKTTLVKLMLGLLKPNSGRILIGGQDIHQLAPLTYRELIGTVMQEDQLFAGSIADNISFFDPEPDHARIEECADLAAVLDDIRAMPMSFNTLIGDMGTVLSGGQKQRVLLARALYKRPKLLFLDEATSHLDVVKERQVNQAIKDLNLTRIIIAHRPETIASVDRVFHLAPASALPGDIQSVGVRAMSSVRDARALAS